MGTTRREFLIERQVTTARFMWREHTVLLLNAM